MVLRALLSKFKPASAAAPDPVEKSIGFVSATRFSETDFWNESALGISLKPLLGIPGTFARIVYENQRGLSAIYNESILDATSADILVFLHDDVWFYDDDLLQKIRSGHEAFDVLGVAGNKRRSPKQPSWAFVSYDEGDFTVDGPFLAGAIGAGNPDKFTIEQFGPTPCECELLDGVFISALRKRLVVNEAIFDEQFEFHFYDLDFCRTARAKELTMGTWPLQIIHQSPGAFGGNSWRSAFAKYLEKWKI